MKNYVLAAAAAVAAIASSSANAAYVFVGSWHVGEGPAWTTQPTVYSAQEAAALLFGGTASQYAISTNGNSVANINHQAHVDGYGDSQFLTSTVAENFKVDDGTSGYDYSGTGPDYSAYVLDHSCQGRYGDPSASCAGELGENFAFRLSGGVPEPESWALLIGGFGLVGGAVRRRSTVRVTYA